MFGYDIISTMRQPRAASTCLFPCFTCFIQVQTLNQIFDGSGVAVTISLYKTPSVRESVYLADVMNLVSSVVVVVVVVLVV